MKHILIVDDEQDLCDILRFNLEAEGYRVTTAHSAEEAKETGFDDVDLILLDVMMPGMSGFELASELGNRTPIIFLTAKDAEDDVLHGFQLGADDYIAKPFSVKQLTARVKAVLNRTTNIKAITSFEGLLLDEETKTVTLDGKHIVLTKTEFTLLKLLLTEQGRVFSRQELLEKVWPDDVIVTDRTVDVNITRLRKKLGSYAPHIATRQGFGYYFKAETT